MNLYFSFMTDGYKLYYWEAPFRGNFIQLLLEELNCGYQRFNASEIYPQRSLKIKFPGMAPPYLYDASTKTYWAQMPAIMMYLARKHKFLPKDIENQILISKLIADCHDILLEFTNFYGKEMWTKKDWKKFRQERFSKWLQIFEKTGELHELRKTKGYLLGSKISVADITTTALFGSMLHTFPSLEDDFKQDAPNTLELIQRIENRPRIKKCLEKQRKEWGDIYCGGEIENSLRQVIQ